MKNAPIILIVPSTDKAGVEFSDLSLNLSQKYPEAILAAGGLPWIVPCVPGRPALAEAVRRCAGVMLTGGDDLAPELYARRMPRELRATIKRTAPARDLFELELLDEVFRQRKPLLAICRGHQLLNVALGGTLFADIRLQQPRALNHQRSDRKDQIVHEVDCAADSLLRRIARGSRLGVNSSHHQAVARIAKSLRVTAVSIDGIVECLELAPENAGLLPWMLSLQFHPERLFARHEQHLRVFTDFIRACRIAGWPIV